MSRFQAARQAANIMDASRSSVSSLDPTLSLLSPKDAEILDAIVAKCPNATTFMTVFKAYSEVLQQRGLDPGDDIVYYKQLLKLGVVKGTDWGTKWDTVKNQLNLDLNRAAIQHSERRILPSQLSGLLSQEEDAFTHADDTETAVDNRHVPIPRFHQQSQQTLSSITDLTEYSELPSGVLPHLPQPSTRRTMIQIGTHNGTALFPRDSSEILDEVPIRSSTPVSQGYQRERPRSHTPQPRDFGENDLAHSPSRINEAEAWKKIEWDRKVKDAEQFRRESLLTMCFVTWKAGSDWIRDTHAQIVHARDQIQLRILFQRWRQRNSKVKDVRACAAQVAHFRMQRTTFNIWKERTRQKRTTAWKQNIRDLMYKVKQMRDDRIRNDAWTRWRQLYQSRQLYARNLLARIFRRWRDNLHRLATLESWADDFEERREKRTIENVMEAWSRRIQLLDTEQYLVRKVDRRTLSLALRTWNRFAQDKHYSDAKNSLRLLKKMFRIWKDAEANLHVLSDRSNKHLRRRDNLLVRAVLRVWVARERGQLLERVRGTRLTKDAFAVWQQRHQEHIKLQDSASEFAKRRLKVLLTSAYNTWVRGYEVRKNVLSLSEEHYIATLLSRTLRVWRLRLRARLKTVRQAKMVRRYFVEKQAWERWRFAIMQRKRIRILKELEVRRMKLIFSQWAEVTRRKRHEAWATDHVQKLMCKHIQRDALQHWTNRVVGLKLREIDTVEQYDRDCLTSAFVRWKDICHRHIENMSLVDSFHDVKREETLRRMFLNWLTAARKSKMRRLRLAEREQDLRLEIMNAAWEIWRDRFCENILRDLEYRVIIQNQTNTLYRFFIIWQSRSKAVPGIRFYATNLKTKFWDRWRAAMPHALQARKAREMDAKTVLISAFEKWSDSHRKKLALKAVARARLLRLPSPGIRPFKSAPADPPPLQPLLYRPLRSRTHGSAEDDERIPSTSRVSTSAPSIHTRGLSSLLAARPVSRGAVTDYSPSRPAPPLSTAGDDDRREKLWKELRNARLMHPHNKAKSG